MFCYILLYRCLYILIALFLRVDADICVKVGDFGLARMMEEDYYRVQNQERPLPVKWMAPEALAGSKFSTYSDVVRSLIYTIPITQGAYKCLKKSGLKSTFSCLRHEEDGIQNGKEGQVKFYWYKITFEVFFISPLVLLAMLKWGRVHNVSIL